MVPASELSDVLKQIRKLQRMGKKTLEAEVLKEAVEMSGRENGLAFTLLPADDQWSWSANVSVGALAINGPNQAIGITKTIKRDYVTHMTKPD